MNAIADSDQARFRATRRVTLVGAGTNLLLACGQVSLGILGGSQALIADGAHTLSDLAGDLLVLVAARQAARAADESHPYGHGRIETVATVVMGAILIAVAAGFAVDAVERILEPERLLQPSAIALLGAAAAIAIKEALYRYTVATARRVDSRLLEANAWHHRSDAVSSLVVLIGVAGTLAGLAWMDAAATVLVALFIGNVGLRLAYESFKELIDTALEPEKVEAIRASIEHTEGVRSLHMLRTRAMAGRALVDVHLQVDPRISVSEGHQIAETVLWRLKRDLGGDADVTVHIDPEDDEQAAPNKGLPLREELLRRIEPHTRGLSYVPDPANVRLHYLNGRVDLEVFVDLADFDSPQAARRAGDAYERAIAAVDQIGSVEVFFR